jgi:hypothetical protein
LIVGHGTEQTKKFNVAGPCILRLHYMVDIHAKIEEIVRDYIEHGEYFTINRARQYGKTTMLALLAKRLQDEYIVILLSFEGRDGYFETRERFAKALAVDLRESLLPHHESLARIFEEPLGGAEPDQYLRGRISRLCGDADKPVVLMVDEVDKATDYAVFSSFLGLLRDMYIKHNMDNTPAFSSVALAGVHDIKNLKRKIRADSEHSYNSPRYTPSRLKPGSARMTPTNDLLSQIGLGVQWNIATSFDVELSFSAPEIATMLSEYEGGHHTGMDISAVSERLYYYTSGYPFLVSRLCKTIDETPLGWSPDGVDSAETKLLKEANTLFDDLIKNIENNTPFAGILRGLLLEGNDYPANPDIPEIGLGFMYGILKRGDANEGGASNEAVQVSNIVFESRVYNYFAGIESIRQGQIRATDPSSMFVTGGKLNLDLLIERFAARLKAEYSKEDEAFIERQARLLFLCFLSPVINGTGQYVVEPRTRDNRRMDIIIFYGGETFIVELKIWRGEKYEAKGYDQLADYLDGQGRKKGWLISFAATAKQPQESRSFKHRGFEISETIIAYRVKAE